MHYNYFLPIFSLCLNILKVRSWCIVRFVYYFSPINKMKIFSIKKKIIKKKKKKNKEKLKKKKKITPGCWLISFQMPDHCPQWSPSFYPSIIRHSQNTLLSSYPEQVVVRLETTIEIPGGHMKTHISRSNPNVLEC